MQVLRMPQLHENAENAARAIGAVSAIAQHFDAIAYLHADSWFDDDHVERLCSAHERTQAPICSTGRKLHGLDGALLGPCPEVDGNAFVASDCLFLTRKAFFLVASWYLMPPSHANFGDRIVWNTIRQSGVPRHHDPKPSVNCRTAFPPHYEHFFNVRPTTTEVVSGPLLRNTLPAPNLPLPKSPIAASVDARPLVRTLVPAAGSASSKNLRRMRVSLCMIVRNEENNLGRCLDSVADLVDEIILIDTGSTDRTIEIAEAHGAQVHAFRWIDDFSAARNESVRHATGDYVFWMDADERLDDANRDLVRALFDRLSDRKIACFMRQQSLPDNADGTAMIVDHVRLFRNIPGVRWERRLHEQILDSLLRAGARVARTPIVIEHHGYRDTKTRMRKFERNRSIVLQDHAGNPGDPFTLFNLGNICLDLGEFDAAIGWLRQCIALAPSTLSFVGKAKLTIVQTLRTIGRIEEAEAAFQEAASANDTDPEWLFEDGILRQLRGQHAEACRRFEQMLQSPAGPVYVAIDPGIRGHVGRHHLAFSLAATKHYSRAERVWREAVEEVPSFGPAWLGLLDMYQMQGRFAEAQRILRVLDKDPQRRSIAIAARANGHLRRGDRTAAIQVFERAIDRAPRTLWLRAMYCDLLVQAGDRSAALGQVEEILKVAPGNGDALRRRARLKSST